MKQQNKQNTVPNQQKGLFSNPLICAKMFNGDRVKDKEQNVQGDKNNDYEQQKKSHIKVNQNKAKFVTQSKQLNLHKESCQKHLKPLSNIFCSECLSYNVCRTCILEQHTDHEVMQFCSFDQMMNETKQILLEHLQETLKQLKSKENEVKNRTHQVSLIKNSLRGLEEQIVAIISGFFKDIEGKLIASLQKSQQDFNKEIELYFDQFNKTNDQLRDSLMKILDGQINIKQFNKSMVIKEPPVSPNFMNYKNSLQKYKKVFRNVKNCLVSIKTQIDEGLNTIQAYQKSSVKNGKSSNTTKFDKYIECNSHKNEKVNESFLKTLRLLQTNAASGSIIFTGSQGKNKLLEKKGP